MEKKICKACSGQRYHISSVSGKSIKCNNCKGTGYDFIDKKLDFKHK